MDSCQQTLSIQAKDSSERLGTLVRKNLQTTELNSQLHSSEQKFSTAKLFKRKALLSLISFLSVVYKYILSPIFHIFGAAQSGACKYPSETCSEYAKNSLLNNGLFRGSFMAFIRVLSCNPWMQPNAKLLTDFNLYSGNSRNDSGSDSSVENRYENDLLDLKTRSKRLRN